MSGIPTTAHKLPSATCNYKLRLCINTKLRSPGATRSPTAAAGVRRARERHRVGRLAATRFPQSCERQRLLTAKRPVLGTTRDWRGERHGRSKNFSYRTEARMEQCHAAAFNRARTAVGTDKKKYPRSLSLRDAPSVAYGRGARARATQPESFKNTTLDSKCERNCVSSP